MDREMTLRLLRPEQGQGDDAQAVAILNIDREMTLRLLRPEHGQGDDTSAAAVLNKCHTF